MDASRTGKRLAGKTAVIINAVQGIGTASVLAIVKKSPCFCYVWPLAKVPSQQGRRT